MIPGRDQRKCDGFTVVCLCCLQRSAIAPGKKRFLAETATLPDRSDCMDNKPRVQIERRGDGHISKPNKPDLTAGFKQLRACLFVNTSINAPADDGLRVGSIHNGIDLHIGYVVSDDFEWHNFSLLGVLDRTGTILLEHLLPLP